LSERDLPLRLAKEFLTLRQKYATPTGRADWDIFQQYLNEAVEVITKHIPEEKSE